MARWHKDSINKPLQNASAGVSGLVREEKKNRLCLKDKDGFSWWSWGESDPRPKAHQKELLRAQTVISAEPVPVPGRKQSRVPAG